MQKILRILTVALVLVVGLAGCGLHASSGRARQAGSTPSGSSTSTEGPSSPSATPSVALPAPPVPAAKIASRIGCGDQIGSPTTGAGFAEELPCQLRGLNVLIFTFHTPDEEQKAIPPQGQRNGFIIQGPGWLVQVPTQELAGQVRSIIGGQILS